MPLILKPTDFDRTLDQLIPLYNPLVWFRFQDVGGTTVTDSSGNGRNGTAVPGSGTVTLAAGSATITAGGRITIADNAAYSLSTGVLGAGLSIWCIYQRTAGSYMITKGGNGGANYEWQCDLGVGGGAQPGATIHSSSGGGLSSGNASGLTGYVTSRNNAAGWTYSTAQTDAYRFAGVNGQAKICAASHTVTSGYADGTSVVTLGSRVDQATADWVGTFKQFFMTANQFGPLDHLALAMAANTSGFNIPLAV